MPSGVLISVKDDRSMIARKGSFLNVAAALKMDHVKENNFLPKSIIRFSFVLSLSWSSMNRVIIAS